MKEQYTEVSDKMNKTIASLTHEFSTIRAGRANANVLDKIHVDYYGTPTLIGQLASVAAQDAKTLAIQPYDPSVLKAIEKAILISDIGINPNNDGKVIRLIFPPLTEERRKDIVKSIHKIGEDSKVAIRSIRRDFIEKSKDQKKKSEITEDDLKTIEKDIQDMTDKFIKEIDGVCVKKEKEIMEI